MEVPPSLLSELPALLVIAEELHFGRAAERLNISQPRISQIVRRAEDIVGYAIFVRRPHVRLTSAGESLVKAVRLGLRDLNQGLARAAEVAAGRGNTVRMGYSPVAMLTRLPSLLKSFCGKNPDVALQLHEAYSANLWAGLESGRFDLIVSREARAHQGIRNHLFWRDSLVAVLPEGDRLAKEPALSISSLSDRDVVTIDEAVSPQWHHSIASVCRAAGFEPRVAQRVNDWPAILALVASGLGVSVVSSTLSQLRFPGIEFVPLVEGLGAGAFWISHGKAVREPTAKLLRSELIDGALGHLPFE